MEIELRDEALDGWGARHLLAGFETEIADLYPGWTPGAGPSAGPRDFAPPGGRFVVAYADDRPVACGGLKRLDDRAAEVKRLFVAPDARGQGVGRQVLGHLEHTAKRAGYQVVRLDTGSRQPEALRLFSGAGYREIADYNANPFATYWFEKPLR